ncbi:MAG: hypothetical protein M3R57_07440 [Chloroflexota bacterium]|nr:hypothetical protein [Chloroflexota bacterium]
MVDELQTQPVTAEHCPWCSAEIAPALANCPACGAALTGDSDASLPGVTSLDPDAITRGTKVATPQRRSRLLSWISGEYDDGADQPAPPGSLSPPPFEVRREMLRLEIEAETAILQAETDALAAEAALEAHERAASAPVEDRPAAEAEGSPSPAVAGPAEDRSA